MVLDTSEASLVYPTDPEPHDQATREEGTTIKMPPKSIWRKPEAQHFQVVHRSQRDPLINDPEAGDRVLKAVERGNVLKGKAKASGGLSRSELEARLGGDAFARKQRANVGEAAEYGIYFDDTEYDYMQHLRPVGAERGGEDAKEGDDAAEAILLEAPKQRNLAAKEKSSFQLKEEQQQQHQGDAQQGAPGAASSSSSAAARLGLPADVLPSKEMLPADWQFRSQQAFDPAIAGFQPDMNPHLRQTLEALEDDAFVDDELDDDFFDGIIASGEGEGEAAAGAAAGAEGQDWMALPPEGEEDLWKSKVDEIHEAGEQVDESELSLEQRVALFKLRSKMQAQDKGAPRSPAAAGADGEEDTASTVGGGIGGQPAASQSGQRRRSRLAASSIGGGSSIFGDKKTKTRPGVKARYAASEAGQSAFSMSSSAMFRNKGLTGLDEHFDRIEKMYGSRIGADGEYRIAEEDEFDEEEEELEEEGEEVILDENGEPISREDFDSIMDEFLNDFEVLGGKVHQTLGNAQSTPQEKLELVRKALGEARLDHVTADGETEEEVAWTPEMSFPGRKPREKWDVETIQSEYRLHRARLVSRGVLIKYILSSQAPRPTWRTTRGQSQRTASASPRARASSTVAPSRAPASCRRRSTRTGTASPAAPRRSRPHTPRSPRRTACRRSRSTRARASRRLSGTLPSSTRRARSPRPRRGTSRRTTTLRLSTARATRKRRS